ncbi:MAG: acyl--CoA ligase [Proteobacteria bacterium]|nr:acyl--CoA ligase [Pseudomonadota bacterium]
MSIDPMAAFGLKQNPDKPFLLTPTGASSRSQLLRRASALGSRLKEAGIASGNAIVSLENGESFVVAMLGCLLSGTTPVLLDPLVKRELGSAIEMTDAEAVIRGTAGVGRLPEGVVAFTVDDSEGEPYPAPVLADHTPLVYLFTSGSTGKPTLVPKSYSQLDVEIHFLNNLFDYPGRVATLVPWCHIFGFIVSFLVPINNGGLCDLTGGISPKLVLERASAGLLDLVVAVPAVYRVMVQYLENGDIPSPTANCRFVTSGAPLERDLREQFTALTGCGVTDLYGSTEAGGVAYRHDDGPWIVQPHVEIHIDKEGFLAVRSPSVSFGTADEFYGMGDLVRLEGRGFVLEGRKDDIVKIGGRRTALGEVQSVLEACPSVLHAAVLATSVGGVNRLVAYVEPSSAGLDPQFVKSFVRERLADHKVPRIVHVVQELPRTPAGKVDRQRLLAMSGGEM